MALIKEIWEEVPESILLKIENCSINTNFIKFLTNSMIWGLSAFGFFIDNALLINCKRQSINY